MLDVRQSTISFNFLCTPNGVKVSIMLEEIGLPCEVHRVNFETQDQMTPKFISLSPNNKISSIPDPDGQVTLRA